jgi:hypothetical protein
MFFASEGPRKKTQKRWQMVSRESNPGHIRGNSVFCHSTADALALVFDGATATRARMPGAAEREAPAPWQRNSPGQDRTGDLPLDHGCSEHLPNGTTQRETSRKLKV